MSHDTRGELFLHNLLNTPLLSLWREEEVFGGGQCGYTIYGVSIQTTHYILNLYF